MLRSRVGQENTPDYYMVLELNPALFADRDLTEERLKAIRQNYLRLIKQHHPDISSIGNPKKIEQIREAYQILSNQSSKYMYDIHYTTPVVELPATKNKQDPLSGRIRKYDNPNFQKRPGYIGVFMTTNEAGEKLTDSALEEFPLKHQGCHIGFSGGYNFDIIAKRKSSRAIICDMNPENAFFYIRMLEILRESKNRFEFTEKMSTQITQWERGSKYKSGSIFIDANVNFDYSSWADEFSAQLYKETSWLYDDNRFNHIIQLAEKDKIVFFRENICAYEIFDKISKILKENACEIDTVYTSNISEYVCGDDRKAFLMTVDALLHDKDTILIDAARTEKCDRLTQRTSKSASIRSKLEEFFYNASCITTNNEHKEEGHGAFSSALESTFFGGKNIDSSSNKTHETKPTLNPSTSLDSFNP